jgi:phenylpropionate dioxygenase-like ring-hydroxylating dioxygenase large terminal subunit
MPDVELLRDFWYPALRSAEVRGSRLVKATLLGLDLVVGRDARGRAFALKDNCPHRGIPLSDGWFDGDLVECCYHGWKFDPHSGQCREIPSLVEGQKLKLDRIVAGHYPTEERDGYVWVFVPEEGAREGEPPPAPELPVFGGHYRMTHLWADLDVNVDHGIIGLMDPAHGPFVHQAWWWRGRRSIHAKEKTFEPIERGFRIRAHTPSANSAPYKLLGVYGEPITTTIEFVLPNMRFEQIRCGDYWFSSRTTVTPTTTGRCRQDVVAAWNVFRRVPFSTAVMRAFGKKFIRQDQETMRKQAEGLRRDPQLMLVDDADRPAKWYFALKAAHLESRRTGEAMKHPIPEPVTLRWRS